jgi:3-deoxy-D-manno-octulosonic-acid transferase
MAYSIGLTLYNLAARPVDEVAPLQPSRPAGSLVWLHVPGLDSLGGMAELARKLIEDDGVSVVVTLPQDMAQDLAGALIRPAPTRRIPAGAIVVPAPLDFPRRVQAFLDHWRPDLGIMAEGELRPALLHEAAQRKLPLIMVESRAPHLMPGREGWYPGLIRAALAEFRLILALDDSAGRALRRAGADPERLMVTGRLEEASAALPYVESDRAALARGLATRPVWLAADVAQSEEGAVIAAHRETLKMAHRLLLILAPQDPSRAEALARHMEETEGWRVACRQSEEEPETETEVYIVEGGAEYGLWYRLAPVTFLGGSLEGAGCLRNPMEAAAMGSAILYGPRSGEFGAIYGRLGAVRAARMVGSGADLGQALGDLLSPDRAARQAQAAWAIASDGADVTARIMDLVRDILDGTA